MDFVSVASAFSQFHRYLHEGDGEDDMLGSYEQAQDSTASITISSPGTSAEYLGAENLPDGSTQPLLSHAAEAELFLLATNFLLCKLPKCTFYMLIIHFYHKRSET